MRFARSLLALAALCTAAACADGASHITAPSQPALNESAGGGWGGSGNVVGSASTRGGWIGSGNTTEPGDPVVSSAGGGATQPADSTGDGRGGTWVGSGN